MSAVSPTVRIEVVATRLFAERMYGWVEVLGPMSTGAAVAVVVAAAAVSAAVTAAAAASAVRCIRSGLLGWQ